jgi:hypothetical protein
MSHTSHLKCFVRVLRLLPFPSLERLSSDWLSLLKWNEKLNLHHQEDCQNKTTICKAWRYIIILYTEACPCIPPWASLFQSTHILQAISSKGPRPLTFSRKSTPHVVATSVGKKHVPQSTQFQLSKAHLIILLTLHCRLLKNKLCGLCLQANYTDWATATCWQILVPTFADRGVSRGQRGGSPTVVNLGFLDWSRYFSFK